MKFHSSLVLTLILAIFLLKHQFVDSAVTSNSFLLMLFIPSLKLSFNCMRMKNDYLPGGFVNSTYVLPFANGLTNAMAEARNPAGKIIDLSSIVNCGLAFKHQWIFITWLCTIT
jgi:hypothetical protein